MKYTQAQVSNYFKSYVAARHSTSAQHRNEGGKVKHKLKHKKEENGIASADAQVEHGHGAATTAASSQHRAGGGIVEGKPGIDTNHAKLRPGSFVIPKKKVDHAIEDGILRPKEANKFQEGGVPVKLTAGEGILSPEKAARLHAQGIDLNEYAPDTEYPYSPDSLLGMNSGGKIHIKKANRGKFTAYKKRTGKTTEEALHSSDSHVRKMAQFAKNAKKWKHNDGGEVKEMQSGGILKYTPLPPPTRVTDDNTEQEVPTQVETQPVVKSKAKLKSRSKSTSKPSDILMPDERKVDDKKDNNSETTISEPKLIWGHNSPDPNQDVKDMVRKQTNPTIQDKLGHSNMTDLVDSTLGKGLAADRKYIPKIWNAVGQGMYDTGDWIYKHSAFYDESQPKKDTTNTSQGRVFKKGGTVKMQQGGGVPLIYSDPFGSSSLAKLKADPYYSVYNPDKNNNPVGLPDTFFNPEKTPLINTPLEFPNTKQLTADDNSNRLRNSILSNDKPLISSDNTSPTATSKPSTSLFDQLRADEKKYYNVAAATDLSLLAGNLGSRYNPTPKPRAYTPDIYERNVNAEAVQSSKELDKEAATARYDARNTGQSRTVNPAVTANLMDKRLKLGAETNANRENERKSVTEQRNQASLLNLNTENSYNTMEANRLDEFRKEKGAVAGQYVDKLQNLYKTSIEDKYAILGAENQQKIAQEQAKNQFFANFGTTASQAMQTKFDTDYAEWSKGKTPTAEEAKKFADDWKLKNPS